MRKSITLSQACEGILCYKSAAGLSPNTLSNYRTSFAKCQACFASRQLTTSRRSTAEWDRAIILLLRDTGLRASELPEGEHQVR